MADGAPPSTTSTHENSGLRGPAAAGDLTKATPWIALIVGVLLVVIAVVVFLGGQSANSAAKRIATSGIRVEATVTNCVGNLGGSGSNGAGYTCTATYKIDASHYSSVVQALSTYHDPGTVISVTADPLHPSSITLTGAVGTGHASKVPLIVALLLLLAGLVLGTLGVLRLTHRRQSSGGIGSDAETPVRG